MALTHSVINVGATPTLLADAGGRDYANEARVLLENISAATDVFLGASDVALTGARRGVKVSAGAKLEIALGSGEKLYGVAAATADVVVLRTEA